MPLRGVYTAIVTPTVGRGAVDEAGFRSLLAFQSAGRVDGVVVGGTTGESPALTEPELVRLFALAREVLPGSVEVIAATGRSSHAGTLALTRAAGDLGIRTVLVVDPYYVGPSSLEIRREHLAPLAERFPSMALVPYVIPGRTGTRLEPVDVARLAATPGRIAAVKDATGDDGYGRALRARCPELAILSGDDARTFPMIEDPAIRATGVISVVSNLIPGPLVEAVTPAVFGDRARAGPAAELLRPLFDLVTVRSEEQGPGGEPLPVRSRNPVPIKTAMSILGAPVGRCRAPLGRLGPNGLRALVSTLQRVHTDHPDLLTPFARHFGVDVDARLSAPGLAQEYAYAEY